MHLIHRVGQTCLNENKKTYIPPLTSTFIGASVTKKPPKTQNNKKTQNNTEKPRKNIEQNTEKQTTHKQQHKQHKNTQQKHNKSTKQLRPSLTEGPMNVESKFPI